MRLARNYIVFILFTFLLQCDHNGANNLDSDLKSWNRRDSLLLEKCIWEKPRYFKGLFFGENGVVVEGRQKFVDWLVRKTDLLNTSLIVLENYRDHEARYYVWEKNSNNQLHYLKYYHYFKNNVGETQFKDTIFEEKISEESQYYFKSINWEKDIEENCFISRSPNHHYLYEIEIFSLLGINKGKLEVKKTYVNNGGI